MQVRFKNLSVDTTVNVGSRCAEIFAQVANRATACLKQLLSAGLLLAITFKLTLRWDQGSANAHQLLSQLHRGGAGLQNAVACLLSM